MSLRSLAGDAARFILAPANARLIRFTSLAAVITVLALAAWQFGPTAATTVARADYSWLALAFPIYFLAMAVAIVGWHLVGRFMGISQGLAQDARYYTLSTIAGRLPGGIWGLAARVYLYRSPTVNARSAATAWILEQVLVLISGLASLPLWIALRGVDRLEPAWLIGGAAALALLPIGWLVLRRGRPLDPSRPPTRLERYREVLATLPSARQTASWIAIYAVVWALGGLILFATLRAFAPVSLASLPTMQAAWIASRTVALLVAILPSGFGLTEILLGLMLTDVVAAPVAATAAIAVRLVTTIGEGLVAGFFYLLNPRPAIADPTPPVPRNGGVTTGHD